MFKENVLYCHITDLLGSIGAEHYYGKLIIEDDIEIELTYPLSYKQAVYLNKKNSSYTFLSKNKPGDECRQFETKEGIYKYALKYMKAHDLMKKYNILIEGNGGSCPVYIIWSKDKQLKKELNKIYKEYNKVAYYSSKADSLIDKWEDKAREYNLLNF